MDSRNYNSQTLNPQSETGYNFYSYKFFFWVPCGRSVPPATAIKYFFRVENVLDIFLLLSWF